MEDDCTDEQQGGDKMDLLKIYNAVDAVLETLDFNALFPGFHKYKYAIYNSAEICFDGKIMPYQDGFRGDTAIEYNGEYVAIWNIEFDSVYDTEMLAYSLVHEMFHCHQRANGEKRYPSDFVLLSYPGDIDNFEKKYNENLYLTEAYEKHDIGALQKFAYIRSIRMKVYPDMVLQELKVETIEGMAEYVGLKALQVINCEKFANITNDYICKLRQQDNLLFDIRRIAYCSGALYDLCLDNNRIIIHNDFISEQTAYEQNYIAFNGITAEVRHYEFISHLYAEFIREREKLVAEHIKNAEYIVCNAFICGYDPMNMFRVGTLIYCKHFVCLNIDGRVQNINSAVVLKLGENSDQNVIGYYIGKQQSKTLAH